MLSPVAAGLLSFSLVLVVLFGSASVRKSSDLISDTLASSRKRGIAESISRTTEYLNLQHRGIIALVGAGISISARIPNFRSIAGLFNTPGNGPFRTSLGKDLFDASVYHNDVSTSSFHDILRTLLASTRSVKLTAFHYLLATLAYNSRLLRLYSQNVNGINTAIEPLRTKDNDKFRIKAGKRSYSVGNLRPWIVLYNRQNPNNEAIGSVIVSDLKVRPDAFIITSTILKVLGVRRIVREICRLVRDQISKEAAPKVIRGSCNEVA
ncbi:DHS-like NAD/FAD-binding domain-containing protein [Cenococcum geophilum]